MKVCFLIPEVAIPIPFKAIHHARNNLGDGDPSSWVSRTKLRTRTSPHAIAQCFLTKNHGAIVHHFVL
jgi:hypothetical protein